jgi:outer membrane protein
MYPHNNPAAFVRILRTGAVCFLYALMLSSLGCSSNIPLVRDGRATAPAPGTLWKTPTAVSQKSLTQSEPLVSWAAVQQKGKSLTLAEIVDLALQNSPDTRMAWLNSRAAAAGYGVALASWWPSLSLNGSMTRTGEEKSNNSNWSSTRYDAAANLSYLLFNFGGRSAAVDEARQALYAANWTNNAVIQNVVLGVQVAYYNYAGAVAMLEANRISLSDAEANLKAAEERHNVGLATQADVLQAQTAYAEGLLSVQNSEGLVRIARGGLILAMGYPATSSADFATEIAEVPSDTLVQSVDQLVSQALSSRPDLLASRAGALKAAASVRQARAALLPTLTAYGSADRFWLHRVDGHTDDYSGIVSMQVPLFSGFARQNGYVAAKAEADAAKEQARSHELDVIYQVYSAHSDLKTAVTRIKTTIILVNSAEQSELVARGRYKEGIGSILDLLSAQRSLAMARAEQIQSRLGWHMALAQLAHDMGILGLHGDNPLSPGATQQR